MTARLAALNSSAALYAALLAGVFVLALIAGYVYAHEPARDQLVLDVERPADAAGEYILAGAVIEVLDDRLVLDQDGARVEVFLATDVALEELRPEGGAFAPGSWVNVGAEQTAFGFVLTGIVVVEGAAP